MFKAALKSQKVSQHVIDQIRGAILSGKLKPGDKVASERELIDQFLISKGSMREALRVLEGTGLIQLKKGMGGGVFVAEVDMNTTVNNLANFLHFKNVSIRHITTLRYLLEPHLAQIAATEIGKSDIRILETITDQELNSPLDEHPKGVGFHYHVARFSENPLFILLMDFIEGLLADLKVKLKPGPDFYQQVAQDHYRIINCFRNRDGVGAGKEMMNHVLHVGTHLAKLSGEAPVSQHRAFENSSFFKQTDSPGHLRLSPVQELFGFVARKSPEDFGDINCGGKVDQPLEVINGPTGKARD
jgi:GntR family transcriptional repressor for pyruvate dehydrogenase complex